MPNFFTTWWHRNVIGSDEADRTFDGLQAYYHALGKFSDDVTIANIDRLVVDSTRTTSDKAAELAGRLIGASQRSALLLWRETLRLESWLLLKMNPEKCAEAPADDKELRAEVALLLAQVVRLRNVRSQLSSLRTSCCGLGILAMLVLLLTLMIYMGLYQSDKIHSCDWIAIGLLGAIGGLTSSVTRLYTIEWCGPDLLTHTNIAALKWGLLYNLALAALEGAIFACILIAFFVAGFVKTDLFPQSATIPTTFPAVPSTMPVDVAFSAVSAKVVVWAFVAGFSERLLPDLLNQLTKRATTLQEAATRTKATPTGGKV